MPSKLQLDENLWFLYLCLQNSDYKTIDFNGVGDAANLKAPAARMRYTRLRRAIETGSLAGTPGTASQGGGDKPVESQKKRKKISDEGNEEDASTMRTPKGRRLARTSKSPSEAANYEELSPDAFVFGMNLATPSKNKTPSPDVHAIEEPCNATSDSQQQPFTHDAGSSSPVAPLVSPSE